MLVYQPVEIHVQALKLRKRVIVPLSLLPELQSFSVVLVLPVTFTMPEKLASNLRQVFQTPPMCQLELSSCQLNSHQLI